jgi:hypothetical protein
MDIKQYVKQKVDAYETTKGKYIRKDMHKKLFVDYYTHPLSYSTGKYKISNKLIHDLRARYGLMKKLEYNKLYG